MSIQVPLSLSAVCLSLRVASKEAAVGFWICEAWILYKYWIPTSQWTLRSYCKDWPVVMLYREVIAVCCQDLAENAVWATYRFGMWKKAVHVVAMCFTSEDNKRSAQWLISEFSFVVLSSRKLFHELIHLRFSSDLQCCCWSWPRPFCFCSRHIAVYSCGWCTEANQKHFLSCCYGFTIRDQQRVVGVINNVKRTLSMGIMPIRCPASAHKTGGDIF